MESVLKGRSYKGISGKIPLDSPPPPPPAACDAGGVALASASLGPRFGIALGRLIPASVFLVFLS